MVLGGCFLYLPLINLSVLTVNGNQTKSKKKRNKTKQNKINKNYLLFTSEDDIISTMQESYDKVT